MPKNNVRGSWRRIRPWNADVREGQPDIVDTFKYDDVGDPRLRQHFTIKPSESTDPQSVAQDTVTCDPEVEDSEPDVRVVQPSGQVVRPAVVRVKRRSTAIGDRVAKQHDGSDVFWRDDVDAGEEEPRRRRCIDGEVIAASLVTWHGGIGSLYGGAVLGDGGLRCRGIAGHIEIDGDIG